MKGKKNRCGNDRFQLKLFRVVSMEEGRLLADKWNVPFVEVSAMNFEVRRFF